MSRSRRKTPIVGHTTCRSEREDKKLWHQRWRTHERTALASELECSGLRGSKERESNVWSNGTKHLFQGEQPQFQVDIRLAGKHEGSIGILNLDQEGVADGQKHQAVRLGRQAR